MMTRYVLIFNAVFFCLMAITFGLESAFEIRNFDIPVVIFAALAAFVCGKVFNKFENRELNKSERQQFSIYATFSNLALMLLGTLIIGAFQGHDILSSFEKMIASLDVIKAVVAVTTVFLMYYFVLYFLFRPYKKP